MDQRSKGGVRGGEAEQVAVFCKLRVAKNKKRNAVRGWEAVVDAMDGAVWEQVDGGSGGGSGARWRCALRKRFLLLL